ncbi:hypothetical protein CCACVL1_30453 [Corchorus capsularis]|uniref:Uncharacterized protein n=1 Tax=Corchorus capsularis TaxID=210143 RepID=A0A1R3FXE4_COCAP|nr:hypothetical protein CCACVL1_30453 [Corchorus capsularis]
MARYTGVSLAKSRQNGKAKP